MKQKAIIPPSFERFELEQFGTSYHKIFAILFLFFLSSPFYTLNRIENDRKVLDNFQTCAEMKHRTIQVLRKRKTVIRITHTLFRAREII